MFSKPGFVLALRPLLIAASIGLIGLATAQHPFWLFMATSALISYILVSSFNIVFGYAGQLSLSHTVVYALGAYTSALLTINFGLPFLLALTIAVVVAAVGGLLIAIPTARLGGIFLAIGTLAFGIGGEEILLKWTEVTGGVQGLMGIRPPEIFGVRFVSGQMSYFVLVGIFVLLTAEISFRFADGSLGHRFIALRDNARFLEAIGVAPKHIRIQAFVLSGAMAGLAGVLFAHLSLFLSAPSFSLAIMIQILVALLLGGVGSAWGPVLGAGALLAIQEGGHHLGDPNAAMGLGIILLIVAAPAGLVGIVRSRLGGLGKSAEGTIDPAELAEFDGGGAIEVREAPPIAVSLMEPPIPDEAVNVKSLAIESVNVSFGGVHAVNDLSLSIPVGRVTGLIGPNGAGKTSLVNAVTGYVRASSGRAMWEGRNLLDLSAHQIAKGGLVRTFQKSQLIPSLDIVSNVMLARSVFRESSVLEEFLHTGRSPRDQRAARDRAMDLLQMLNILPCANEYPGDVPYGVVRRAEVARALAQEPELLLLDEPGAGLTAQEREELADTMVELSDSGLGVLLIDHNVSLVAEACSHIHVLVGGKELAAGPPATVLEDVSVLESYFGRVGAK